MKSKVVLVRCESYEETAVHAAVAKGLSLLGGIGLFVKPAENIVLKVNLLVGDPPEKCVTTHPSVFKAIATILRERGVHVQYGDSPSFGTSLAAAKKAGIASVAEELGVPLADFKEGREVFYAKGVQNKKFYLANGVLDADGLISLPKFKTHGLERFTGAVKNQFGCVVAMRKGEFHVKLPNAHDFGRMLVDLNALVHPRLYIMDGIMAMEGNGPRGGNPRAMNVLLFSADPIALDATACRMIGLEPTFVPTTRAGMEAGAGTHLEEEIELLGDDFSSFVKTDFDVNRTPIHAGPKSSMLSFINTHFVPKPYIDASRCTQCGTCVTNCPVEGKAVNWAEGDKTRPPVYNYDICIRCYCCQELCPESAIELRDPFLRKVINMI